jgi:2-dehydro-3-deoxygluconokinase
VTGALGVLGEGLVELGLEPAPDTSVTLGYGGDAANAAVMAARLGAEARILGRVGGDTLGERLLSFWSEAGVDVGHVLVDPEAPTGIYVNERGAEGLRRFDYHRSGSAGSRLEPGDAGPSFLDGLGVLHVTGITLAVSQSSRETALELARRAREQGVAVSLAVNHRPALGGDVETLRAAARRADVVFVSEEEAGNVFDTTDATALAAALGVAELVLTRGENGAVLVIEGALHTAPAPAVSVVDPAGAGDALAGGYLAARLQGEPPHRALTLGVIAAALSCRVRGCALSYPSRDEVVAAAHEA